MPASPVQPIVIWFGRVGDMILLSALLNILHLRYGERCHVIGAGGWLADIYAGHEDVARVSCLHRYTAFLFDREWWRLLRRLRRSRNSPVYVCEYDPRKLARIQRLLTLSGTDAARCLFLTRTGLISGPGTAPAHPAHWVDRLVSFGRLTPPAFDAAAYPWPAPPPLCAPRLTVTASARADCVAWITAQGWSTRPLVLIQPGNRRTMRGRRLQLSAADDKAWPLERWAALLRRIHAHMPEAVILLCGAPRESLLLGWISSATQLPAVASAELPLPRLFALCTMAHSMISVDTGPAHAAAALSLPLVVMFGAHSPLEWLPRSPSGSAVVAVGGPPQSLRLDAVPMEAVFDAWRSLAVGAANPVAQPAGSAAAGDALRPTAARAIAP